MREVTYEIRLGFTDDGHIPTAEELEEIRLAQADRTSRGAPASWTLTWR